MANELESFFKGGEAEAESKPKTAQEVVQAPEQAPMRREASDLEAVLGGSAQPTAQVPEDDDDISPLGMLWDVGAQLSSKLRGTVGERAGAVGSALGLTPELFEQTWQGTKMGVLASRVYGQDAISQQGTRPGMEGTIGPPSMFPTEIAQEESEKAQQFLELPEGEVKSFEEELKRVQESPTFQESLEKYNEVANKVEAARGKLEGDENKFLFDLTALSAKMIPSIAVGTVTRSANLGLGVMFGQVYADKTAELTSAGVDPTEIPIHAFATSTIETATEKLPFNILLKKVGWSGVRKLLTFTVAEGLQEGASSLLQSAWDKNTLNPDLTLGEALRDAGYETALGTAAGPVVGGPSILYQHVQNKRTRKKLEDEVEQMKKDFAEDLKKQDEADLQKKQEEAQEVKKEADTLEAALAEEAEVEVKLEPHVQEFLKDNKLSLNQLLKLNTEGRGTITEKETAQLASVLPGWKGKEQEAGEVVDTGFTYYQEEVKGALERKAQVDAQIAAATEAGLEIDSETIKEAETVAEDVTKLEKLAKTEKEFAGVVKAQIREHIKSLAPGMKIYIGDNVISSYIKGMGIGELGTSHGRTFKTTDGVHVIEFDIANMLDHDGNFTPGMLQETVNHEFGHSLINEVFESQPAKVREALTNAYLKDLNKATKEQALNQYLKTRHGFFWNKVNVPGEGTARYGLTMKEFMERIQITQEKKFREALLEGTEKVKSVEEYEGKLRRRIRDRMEYEFDMPEWTAVQAEKALSEQVSSDPEVQRYYKRVNRFLKKLHKHYQDTYGYNKTYKTWLRLLQSRRSYEALIDTYHEAKKEYLDKNYDAIAAEQVAGIMDEAFKALPSEGGGGKSNWVRPPYDGDSFRSDVDTYNKALRYGLTLTQLAKLNPHIEGLQDYRNITQKWWNEKSIWTEMANERLMQWKDLGGKKADWLGKFLLDLTVESYRLEKQLGPNDPEFQRLAERWNVDEDMFALYDMISQDFTQVLDTLEEALVNDAQRQFIESPDDLKAALAEIQTNMNELRNRNYFPLARFGESFVRVLATKDQVIEGQEYKTGDVTSFEAFETEKEMKKRLRQLKHRKDLKAEGGELTDIQRQFAGFPPQFIEMLKNRLELTDPQQHELNNLIHDLSPAQSYKKHLKNRKNTPGFSSDAVRSYANYFLHFSSHIARVKYKGPMLDAIKKVHESADAKRKQETEAVKRDQITKHLQRHYDYIMNPGNELANLRALGFIWYLGFVPKSALVNLTQIPLVTLPYLSAKYGDAKALKALLKAQKDVVNYWKAPQKLSPGQHNMLETLKKSGIIDESMATEIAATAEGSVLQRLVPGTFLKSEFAGRAIRDFAGRAAWLFQQAEKYNRRISALAAYDLAKQKGASQQEAIDTAWDVVESTQFEYARWNRPEFMRYKKSSLFLFWMYLQNILFFTRYEPGRGRFILMLLAMAGLSGLPFAEDLMDIYDYLARKFNKLIGQEKAPINARKEVREFIAELGMNPDLVMHGASRYSFGLPAVGDAIGVPIPNVDISGSLSLGRVVPGVEPIFGRQGDFNTRMARASEEVVGAVWTMPIQLMRAIADDNPNTLKRFEKAMPSFARNLSKAYRYAASQEETIANGAALAEFDLQDSKHVAEIIAQGAGFAPTRVQEVKEKYYMTREIAQYYEIRRRQFMRLLDFARANDDRKMEADVWDQIRDYNNSVPFPAFKLTGKDIKNSIKNRTKSKVDVERGRYTTKRGTQMGLDVDKAFPNLDEEGEPTPQGLEDFFTEPAPK